MTGQSEKGRKGYKREREKGTERGREREKGTVREREFLMLYEQQEKVFGKST